MQKLNRILIPTDFSDSARKAYSYAESLLEIFGGEVDIIHIVPTIKYIHESMKKVGYPFSLDHDIYPRIVEDLEEQAKKELENNVSAKHRGSTVVKIGRKASEAILEYAHKQKFDLIVMGAQGSHADHIIRGHVTEKVIRFSGIPVLSISGTVMPEETENILVSTDFSDFSFHALLPAAIMAGRLKSEITLFHVKELHGSEPEDDDSAGNAIQKFRKKVIKKLDSFLQSQPGKNLSLIADDEAALKLLLDHEGETYRIPLDIDQARGVSAHYEIVDYAEENAGMIVIATHGRSGLKHMFMGSTTEKVIQWAKIPVLTIRPKEMHKEMHKEMYNE